MNKEFDKEFDLLLRGHRKNVSRDGGSSSAHLDADELSAYAENALPAATRTRYVEHLADCDNCRGLATNVALAAGLTFQNEEGGEVAAATTVQGARALTKSSWRAWLTALFSPRALRYAAPVLAALVVGVVAFVAVRQQREGGASVAVRSENNESPATAVMKTDEGAEQKSGVNTNEGVASGDVAMRDNAAGASPVAKDAPPPLEAKQGEAPNAPPPPSTDAVASSAAPSKPEVIVLDGTDNAITESEKERGSLAKKNVADLPPADSARRAANQSVAENTDALEREDDEAFRARDRADVRNEQQSRQQSARQMNDSRAGSRAGGVFNNKAGGDDAQNNATFGAQQAPRAAAPKSAPDEDKYAQNRPSRETASPSNRETRRRSEPAAKTKSAASEEAEPEARAIAGRRFRRQGGAWVDTAYRSGQSVTNVARGSEQFRALVADEPDLRRVAEQLGGEVVVIWKGRAYRIR